MTLRRIGQEVVKLLTPQPEPEEPSDVLEVAPKAPQAKPGVLRRLFGKRGQEEATDGK